MTQFLMKRDIAGENLLVKQSKAKKTELIQREIDRMRASGFGLQTNGGFYHFSNPPRRIA